LLNYVGLGKKLKKVIRGSFQPQTNLPNTTHCGDGLKLYIRYFITSSQNDADCKVLKLEPDAIM
jgi:hypothetical protein